MNAPRFLSTWASRLYASLTSFAGVGLGIRDGALFALPFSRRYRSTQQTMTLGGLLTLAHSLTVSPELLQFHAVCITADVGYVPGDRVTINYSADSIATTAGYGLGVYYDASNIYIRVGNGGFQNQLINKGSGAAATPVTASWQLIAGAWAP